MAGRFKYGELAKYPHMKPRDVAVWERFIAANPDAYDTVDYDFAVGKGVPQLLELDDNIRADGKILTQKKIDVVGYTANAVHVIEIKPTANMSALGQIMSYYTLYLNQEDPELLAFAYVIAGKMDPELVEIYAANGVNVLIA